MGKLFLIIVHSKQHMLSATNGTTINPKAFERLNISKSDQTMIIGFSLSACLLQKQMQKQYPNSQMLQRFPRLLQEQGSMHLIFSLIVLSYGWNEDNYGPIWMPVKGATVKTRYFQSVSV